MGEDKVKYCQNCKYAIEAKDIEDDHREIAKLKEQLERVNVDEVDFWLELYVLQSIKDKIDISLHCLANRKGLAQAIVKMIRGEK